MTKQNYIEQILGMSDLVMFAITYAFGLLGIFISILWHASNRDKSSQATPVPFSWIFLLKDNIQRITLSLILLFVGIRFSKQMFGQDLTMWVALGVGLTLDKVSQFLKNLSLGARK